MGSGRYNNSEDISQQRIAPASCFAEAGMDDKNEKKVDAGWKERVAKEREEAAKAEASAESETGEARKRPMLPKPSLSLLFSTMASQALLFLGEIENPFTGKKEQDLDQAKYTIDMLQVLREKTAGNITPEESKLLDGVLYDLRMRYVNAAGL
jgi:hypothetical protein